MKSIWALLQLMRPANIVTAIADILLGFAAAGAITAFFEAGQLFQTPFASALFWLVVSTIGLYGGGVVMNDVFDMELDKVERPERPLPRGIISLHLAMVFGIFLLALGVVAAAQVGSIPATIAGSIAFLAVLYDAFGKHQEYLGPLNMGLCRSLNLALGMSVLPFNGNNVWLLLIPVIYISGITRISQGEVHGYDKRGQYMGLAAYVLVFILAFLFSTQKQFSLFFLILLALAILPPLFKAIKTSNPQDIGKAVKAGVLSLIILNATLAVGFVNWQYGLFMLFLLPISMALSRFFAVT